MEPNCTSNLMTPIFCPVYRNTVRSMISQSCCKFGNKKKTRWFVFAANDERNMQIVNRPLSSFITRSISSCPSENSGIVCDFLFESDSRTFRYKQTVRHYISQTAAHTAFSWTENGGLRTRDIESTAAMNCRFKTPYGNYNPTN